MNHIAHLKDQIRGMLIAGHDHGFIETELSNGYSEAVHCTVGAAAEKVGSLVASEAKRLKSGCLCVNSW